jgi:asparagine synthase (glutamine-hydrolysing)
MCGITGYVGQVDNDLLKNMADQISHRGPDGDGYYIDPNNGVHLAHRRLSILDISGGAQPMLNQDSTLIIVFNGEIYNHLDLRFELASKGYQFKSINSDTEVLIHGYAEWGYRLVEKLNGMFAFCIYDKKNQQLFLARDRFGEKPLYFCNKSGSFAFGSEITPLLIYDKTLDSINHIAIQKFFGYGFIPAPLTIYKNISKLPGGHYMFVDLKTQKLTIKKYWEFIINPDSRYFHRHEMEIADELQSLLIHSVKNRLVADVPVGIFLSGGIDSAVVLSCATRSLPKNTIHSYTIGFHEKQFDESHFAKDIANHLGSSHSEKIISIDEIKSIAQDVLGKFSDPIADSSILPTYILSKFASKSVKVALGGDGGDELFAGYAPFKALNAARIYSKLLPYQIQKVIRQQIEKLPVSHNYFSFDFKAKRFLRGVQYKQSLWNPIWLGPLLPSEISELMHEKVEPDELFSEAISAWDSSLCENIIDRTSEFYTRFYLQDDILAKVDRSSMLCGLEVRAPFLDKEVVNFAQRLPAQFKFKKNIGKYILRLAFKDSLPKDTLRRPKHGFAIPIGKWIKNWTIGSCAPLGFNQSFINQMKDEHNSDKSDNRLFLWSWITLKNCLKLN